MNEFPWEDNLLERKTESDLKDLLKSLVAFSNSVKPDHTAVILIGEKDNGDIQGVSNPDNIQKKIRKECDKIYPPILWKSIVYKKNDKYCIRIEIEYSEETPHFGGSAWIRKGSETIKATDEVFQRLIDIRSSKVTELSKWLDKYVTVVTDYSTLPPQTDPGIKGRLAQRMSLRWRGNENVKIICVNQYWITFDVNSKQKYSEPIKKITLSFDNINDRLKLIVDS